MNRLSAKRKSVNIAKMIKEPAAKMLILCVIAIVTVLVSLFFGAAELSASHVIQCLISECETATHHMIFNQIRLPRVLIGFGVGAGLAISGACLQTLTRNSLADPYLFGVMSGAGLGASIAMVYPQHIGWLPFNVLLPLAAFIGALVSVALVQFAVVRTLGNRVERMVLAGVAVSFMLGAISHFILYLAQPFAANTVVFWLLGSLARAQAWYVWLLLPLVSVCFIAIFLFGRRMDALLLGDETAQSLGVNVALLRLLLLSICALLTACIVAFCGGIGFVGLMIPHTIRFNIGATTRTVLTGSLLLGGAFIVATDALSRTLISDQELPIGVITAAIGSVFFMLMLRKT